MEMEMEMKLKVGIKSSGRQDLSRDHMDIRQHNFYSYFTFLLSKDLISRRAYFRVKKPLPAPNKISKSKLLHMEVAKSRYDDD